jgi:putative copper export protein/mono/diheme cytochrome c family protein
MTDALYVAAILVRLVHLGAACLLTGTFAFLVLVARPAVGAVGPAGGEAFAKLDRRVLALGAVALGVAMATGLIDLVRQAYVATASQVAGRFGARALGLLLTETRYGDVWLGRHALWLLLAVLLGLRRSERDGADWLALRLAGFMLAAAALAISAAAGHAASAPESVGRAIGADGLHLLAGGIWAGALVPFVLFLRWVRSGGPAVSLLAAVVAVRRFSMLGLLCVAVIVATGIYAVPQQVDSVPALLGTVYGRWLCIKLALVLSVLAVALFNRAYLRPRLQRAAAEGPDERSATTLVLRLGRSVLLEAFLAAAILGTVAVLGLTAPARHDPISWPLPFRLAWDPTTPSATWAGTVVGSPLAMVGLGVALLALAVRHRWRRGVLVVGMAALCLGLGLVQALRPLAVDAYPTTYARSTVTYTAASIVRGHGLYREHCQSCHGPDGASDGVTGASVAPRRPSTLTGRRVADHTAGDLFWWLTYGTRDSTMPAFGDRLSAAERWDLVNLVRTLSAAESARSLAPTVAPTASIVAPDFGYSVGVGGERWLREYRGQTIVLLVFFRLPESQTRLLQLADSYFDFRTRGAEILAVPLEGASAVYRILGPEPVLFPFAIGGAENAAATYRLFHRAPSIEGRSGDPSSRRHVEMLVDRQGYLRARWLPPSLSNRADAWNDLSVLLAEVDRLAREPASAPELGEHIH